VNRSPFTVKHISKTPTIFSSSNIVNHHHFGMPLFQN
jgi:hypothetical protein